MHARHDLVWLSDAGWDAAGATKGACDAVAQWQRNGYPAVVRRAEPDTDDSVVCAGIALPPDAQGMKKRIPLRIAAAHIRKRSAPLALHEAIPALPARWQPALAQLAAQGIGFRVYGSAAWQALTGMAYVSAASDIDLLFQPQTRAELDAGLLLLAAHARTLPLDGEVVFPGGAAVAWKEWMTAIAAPGKPRVLVKDQRHVRLMTTHELLNHLEDERCASH